MTSQNNTYRPAAASSALVLSDLREAHADRPKSRGPVGAPPVDPRDSVYAMRRRALELHDQADELEQWAWELDRALRRR